MTNLHTMKWSFQPSHETFQGRVVRIGIYLQTRVLEINDLNDSVFYLIYFKNILLGGGKIKQVVESTFIDEVFQQGIIISPSHPLFSVLLPKNRKAHIPNINNLFTELQNDLSLQEIAIAATRMDSFIQKQQLIAVIREIFNHFRRNGQFLKAYQTAKVLLHFSPKTKTTKQLIGTPEFEKYRKMEETNPTSLLEQDSLSKERFYYHHRNERKYEVKLHELLKQQSRHLDQLVLFIHLFEVKHDFYSYEQFIELLKNQLKHEERYEALKFLMACSPEYTLFTEDILREQIHLKLFHEALQLIANQSPYPPAMHTEMIESMLDGVDSSTLTNVRNMNKLISKLYPDHPEKKEDIVRRIVISLLKQNNPTEVKKWLQPIRQTSPNLHVLDEVDQLECLSQNTDQLTKLGELYYQFSLLDQSIECFTWEMELHPNAIDPVRWLSKLYKEKGMLQESEGYKKLSVFLAKKE
ncbi:hypothetical protein [Ammoniphilus sp. 3BR4]|uniref:hypothetical protein n=1 Tax=Ammoniphilus sp. 3BR4 TaxID=3158265 RepID=UPI003466B7B7